MIRSPITVARCSVVALFVLMVLASNAQGQGAASSQRNASSSSLEQVGSGDRLVQKPKAYWDNYQSQIVTQVLDGSFGSSMEQAAPFQILFTSYVERYSENCRAYLPARHDTLTITQGTETRDRFGNVVSHQNGHSATIEVDPRFTPKYRQYASSLGSTSADNLNALVGIMSGKTSSAALFAPGLDADRFFQIESCQSAAMRQLGENLLRAATGEPSLQRAGVKDLAKAIAEDRRSREEMRAQEAVQAKAQAEASVRQNVCISDDLTTEWRNPPDGGRMESLKRQLVESLRERAKTPGYDQTRWIVVDSHYYPAWTPGTSIVPNLVSTEPGGSCGVSMHRETLALAP